MSGSYNVRSIKLYRETSNALPDVSYARCHPLALLGPI